MTFPNPPGAYTSFNIRQYLENSIGSLSDGTVAAPGLRFSNDTDTGLYRPSSDIIGVVAGGVELLRADGLSSGQMAVEVNKGGADVDFVVYDSSGAAALTVVASTGATTLANFTLGTVTITGGTIDGAVIGGTTPAAGTFSSVLASVNDSGALGASGTGFSDLFLASGAVIDFNAGNVTLAHSTNILTLNADELLINYSGNPSLALNSTDAVTGFSQLIFRSSGTGMYRLEYDIANTRIALWSTNTDGAGLNGNVFTVADGTDDVAFMGGLSVAAAQKLFLDGGSNTYLIESSGDVLDFYTGGSIALKLNASQTAVFAQSITVPDYAKFTTVPAADAEASGLVFDFRAGEAISYAEVVYLETDGDVNLADANSATTAPVFAIATAAVANTATGTFLTHGIIRNDAWAWTPKGTIYLSATAGGLTQTAPAVSGDQVQVLGFATHADRMFFNPSLTVVEVA